jgi:hypothetical protein
MSVDMTRLERIVEWCRLGVAASSACLTLDSS